jgi:hypothetical protein
VGDAALSADVPVPVFDVGEVEEDQLDAVGVDAAPVGGDQRIADESGVGATKQPDLAGRRVVCPRSPATTVIVRDMGRPWPEGVL